MGVYKMSEEKIRRRTIRLSPFVDEELNAIAKKNKMSVNKLIGELVVYHINELDKINNVSNVAVILNNLDNLQKEVVDLQKKCNWLNILVRQIFVNSGFARNQNFKEDEVYQNFVRNYYNERYEKKFDS